MTKQWKNNRLYKSKNSNEVLATVTINNPNNSSSSVTALILGQKGKRFIGSGTAGSIESAKKWIERQI
jgi:hypothetical protein